MRELRSAEQPVPFEEQLFVRAVEQIAMFPAKRVFVFEDGPKIPVRELLIAGCFLGCVASKYCGSRPFAPS